MYPPNMSPPNRRPSDLVEARRYRITAVLGKGGFGKVYRATMEGAGGFTKDVAIKLLHDKEVPEVSLQRFRDEARILGLIRDRAIVTVDPPTRLAGRWAVVMEYVDGATIQRLMKLGAMPATVVAEIIQEVARALDKVYRAPGPNGEPLRLLHRDIKPGNLQITQDGEVKILDFGIARADFENREAHTQAYVGGTRGYIAPERIGGKEGPEGDIYSLGVTAHLMLTGEKPTRRQLMGLEEVPTEGLDDDTIAMIDLASRMRSVVPEERPTAREVEDICATILRTSANGVRLRRWAERNVPQAVGSKTDGMCGTILTETLAAIPSEERVEGLMDFEPTGGPPTGAGPSMLMPLLLVTLGAGLLVLVFAFVSAGGAAGLGLWLASGDPQETAPMTPELPSAEEPRERRTPKLVDKVRKEEEEEAKDEVEEAEEEKPRPAPARPRPSPRTSPEPKEAPDASEEPDEDAVTYEIIISSNPMGADVKVDGKSVGSTPVRGLELTEGPHRIEITGDAESTTHTISVGRRSPRRWIWIGGETWEEYY